MKFTQIRHATCMVELENTRFLIDPILYRKGTLDPIKGGVDQKNPLVDISVDEALLKKVDYILLTHLHYDHFDSEIINYFGNDVRIICCYKYKEKLAKLGFSNIHSINDKISINDIEIILTKGKHGSGFVGMTMGKSYGFILKTSNNDIIYVTGDTIWCKYVEETIKKYSPNYIIGFAGSATINKTHITLNDDDIEKILEKAPNAIFIVNHMDAWNHCFLTKEKLRNSMKDKNLYIPNDGETIII